MRVEILIRGDNHYARHEAMAWCERNRVGYTSSALPGARRSRGSTAPRKIRRFIEFRYAAKTWQAPRRIIVRIEASPHGGESRFIVTNLAGAPRWLYGSVHCRTRYRSRRTSCTSPPTRLLHQGVSSGQGRRA